MNAKLTLGLQLNIGLAQDKSEDTKGIKQATFRQRQLMFFFTVFRCTIKLDFTTINNKTCLNRTSLELNLDHN
jgi:hypothetical protein